MIQFNKVTKFSTIVAIVLYVATFVGAFYLGILWNQFQYSDTCLDMGGGMNPGNYSICVIKE